MIIKMAPFCKDRPKDRDRLFLADLFNKSFAIDFRDGLQQCRTEILLQYQVFTILRRKSSRLRPMPKETQSSHENLEFQRYPSKNKQVQLACHEQDSLNGKFQTFGKSQKKQFWGRLWAKIGFRKTRADVYFEAARFRVLD